MATMTTVMTTATLLLLLITSTNGATAAAAPPPRPPWLVMPKVNLFSELEKLTRWSQNFVAEQISKGVQTLPGDKNVDLRPLLEVYRPKMRSGWPELNIPVMEPLDVPYVSLDTQDDDVSLRGYLKKNRVSGLSSLQARNLSLNLVDHLLDFGLVFPQLTMVGSYRVNGSLPTRLLIAGEGSYSVTAWNLAVSGSLKLKVAQGTVQVEDVHVRLSLDRLKLYLENFLGGGEVGRVMCETLSRAAPAILEEERDKVSRLASRHVQEVLNRKLGAVEWSPGHGQCLLSVFKLPCLM